MKKKFLIPLILSSFCLLGCHNGLDEISEVPQASDETNEISNITVDYELSGFNNEIKTTEVKNPGMGFYNTKYIELKRDSEIPENHDFMYRGFYHLRIDLSDFSNVTNGIDDYDISDDALELLNYYFTQAKVNQCSLIIRFAYDKFHGNANMEPQLDMIKNHIKRLAEVINDYKDLIIAVECGLIGPWGEMHTSLLDKQDVYNELLNSWLKEVETLPILARKPVFIYKYLGYSIENLEEYNNDNNRLGIYNDGYYGTDLDTGTYETLEAREKETKFINKLNTVFGGECIGEPTDYFSYDEVIKEMNLVNLTYLNYEWDDSIIASWKNKTYNNQSFYTYMVNHMGFKLYVDSFDYSVKNNRLFVDIKIANMGFSPVTRNLKAQLYFDDGKSVAKITKSLSDTNNNINLETIIDSNLSTKIYLKITDDMQRCYELMNGCYIDDVNYLGEIKLKENK